MASPATTLDANDQEANRAFWRQTVLPLVQRTAKALANWLSPAYGDKPLDLRPDLDAIEALSPERESLWTRLDKSTFLTPNEKRAAAGYGPTDDGDDLASKRFNPFQPRVPAGYPGGGQWTDQDGNGDSNFHLTQARSGRGRRRTPQEQRRDEARDAALDALSRVREPGRDPHWRVPPTIQQPGIEGDIARFQYIRAAAEARLRELANLGHNQGPQLNPFPGIQGQPGLPPRLPSPERPVLPYGFDNVQQYLDFALQTRRGLDQAGYPGTDIYVCGSGAQGFRWSDGSPFDHGERSDYDLAIVNPELMRRAEELGIPLRGRRSRTEPLSQALTAQLGLGPLQGYLQQQAGRPVRFMIYQSRDALVRRRQPYIQFPGE